MTEQFMNLDLKAAYERSMKMISSDFTIEKLCELSALLLKDTGTQYNTPAGSFDSSHGDLRLVNVTAGFGGRSYMDYRKIATKLEEFCKWLNVERKRVSLTGEIQSYKLSFIAHYRLVTIHPWADGNGRISRLLMNMLQREKGLLPTIVHKEHKTAYIESLVKAREEENEDVFCQFMFGELQYQLSLNIKEYLRFQKEDVPVNVPVNLTIRQIEIVNMMKNDSNITIRQMSEHFHLSEKTIKRDIATLKQLQIVSRKGSDKNGRWVVGVFYKII